MYTMAENVFESVTELGYDGVVFECAAVWAIETLVKSMAEKLHQAGKVLAVVIPPLRSDKDQD